MSPLLLNGEGATPETMALVFATESRSVYELLTMQGNLRFPEDFLRDWTENILFIICGGSTAALAADSSALGESGGPYLDMHGAPRAYVRRGDRCHWEVYIKELLAAVFITCACYENLMEMESSLLKPTHSLDSGLQEKRKRAASNNYQQKNYRTKVVQTSMEYMHYRKGSQLFCILYMVLKKYEHRNILGLYLMHRQRKNKAWCYNSN